MKCRYCQIIQSTDKKYPIREATFDLNSNYPRCNFHWRFTCHSCGRPTHFNGITWCEKTKQFTCIRCGVDHRAVREPFWNWEYYYAIGCKNCGERHPALDRLEFEGEHPWQLHPTMRRNLTGLNRETAIEPRFTSSFISEKNDHVTDEEVSRQWNGIAEKWTAGYTEHGDVNREHVIDPTILRILGDVKNKRILDAGCGAGYLCRKLARKGARVTGIDLSSKLIKMARLKEKEQPLGIRYYTGSLSNLEMLSSSTFDVVISNMALMDTLNLKKALEEISRVLKNHGVLIFSISHPCFASSCMSEWERQPPDSERNEDRLYRKIDRYFDRGRVLWAMSGFPPVSTFHRTLSDYINLLITNKFVITHLEEPVPDSQAMEEHSRDFANDYDRIPLFLIIGAKKLSSRP